MQYQYRPSGVCSRQITIDVENGVVQNVSFVGGCNGNLQGIGALVKGMKIEDVIARLEHIRCNGKPTSWHRHSKKYRQKLPEIVFYTEKSAVRKDSTSSGFFYKTSIKIKVVLSTPPASIASCMSSFAISGCPLDNTR